MLGVVAARAVALRAMLRDAPRSLSALSSEHADGWGIAWRDEGDWSIGKGILQAARCPGFEVLSQGLAARVAVAHVRKKTVGETSLANTHPFRRGRFVFAHNGTADAAWLARRSSPERMAEIEGDTDSERLFAFAMTHVDEAGDVARGLSAATRALVLEPGVGSVNFLLSDGQTVHAFRLGRTLYLLVRGAGAGCRRTPLMAVASEQLTDEPWIEIEQGALVELRVPEDAGARRLVPISAASHPP